MKDLKTAEQLLQSVKTTNGVKALASNLVSLVPEEQMESLIDMIKDQINQETMGSKDKKTLKISKFKSQFGKALKSGFAARTPEYDNISLDEVKTSKLEEKNRVERIIESPLKYFFNDDVQSFLYLLGPTGTGKTSLALKIVSRFYEEAAEVLKGESKKKPDRALRSRIASTKFVAVDGNSILALYSTGVGIVTNDKLAKKFKEMDQADILLLDEFPLTLMPKDLIEAILKTLVPRFVTSKKTILTTNYPPRGLRDLAKAGFDANANSSVSRLDDKDQTHCYRVKLTGGDKRDAGNASD